MTLWNAETRTLVRAHFFHGIIVIAAGVVIAKIPACTATSVSFLESDHAVNY